MHQFLRTTALAAALLAAFPAAQAATQTYAFSGAMDSGYYNSAAFSGQFSFDDAGLTSIGTEYLSLSSLSMTFLSSPWNLTHAESISEVVFDNGNLLGLTYSASNANVSFSVVPGFVNQSESFIAYDTALGLSGAGSVVYAPVPEPETYAMLLAGLGLMGLRRQKRA
jgi:hypothetical protein